MTAADHMEARMRKLQCQWCLTCYHLDKDWQRSHGMIEVCVESE